MCRLRYIRVQAARDVFYMNQLIQTEAQVSASRNKVLELVRVPRNRRAMLASEILMFMQQFCGVSKSYPCCTNSTVLQLRDVAHLPGQICRAYALSKTS